MPTPIGVRARARGRVRRDQHKPYDFWPGKTFASIPCDAIGDAASVANVTRLPNAYGL